MFDNIQKGALTRKLKGSLGRLIKRTTGMSPFKKTKQGGDKINTNALKKFRKTDAYKKLDTRTKRQINLAITFEKLRRDKKRGGRTSKPKRGGKKRRSRR